LKGKNDGFTRGTGRETGDLPQGLQRCGYQAKKPPELARRSRTVLQPEKENGCPLNSRNLTEESRTAALAENHLSSGIWKSGNAFNFRVARLFRRPPYRSLGSKRSKTAAMPTMREHEGNHLPESQVASTSFLMERAYRFGFSTT
jgi:hypothetical protein